MYGSFILKKFRMNFMTTIISRYMLRLHKQQSNILRRDLHNLLKITATDSNQAIGKRVKVQGWVHAVRKMKEYTFVDISDGLTSAVLQIVIPTKNKPNNLSCGSSITTEGELSSTPKGQLELHVNDICVIGTCDVTKGYPLSFKKTYPEEYIRQYLHFRPRTKTFSATLRLRDTAMSAISDYFRHRGFINVHTPIMTSNDCEGAGELFVVKPNSKELLTSMKKYNIPEDECYFNNKTYLTVSGQMHLEALARNFTKVYTFGPVFRAENSKSRLHLSEFYMLEAEIAFISNIEKLIDEIEFLLKTVAKEIIEKNPSDFYFFVPSEPHWLNKKFSCLTYDNAIQILNEHASELQACMNYGDPLTKEQELFLVRHNNDVPIFVINWPKNGKPFYMKECADDSSKVAAVDLLVPIVGELVGGSVREDDYEKLMSKLPTHSELLWYLELRKFGNVPTSGFGIGFERLLQWLLGISNIKDTIPFPRWPHNCKL